MRVKQDGGVGLLAPGAVSADVIDDRGERIAAAVGGGAYAAIVEQPSDARPPIVCCRDAAGVPVRRPLPAGYPSRPVEDADVPCPACGALDYEEGAATERRRGGRPGPSGTVIANPIVVCRRCGHEERQGTFYAPVFGAERDEDEAEAGRAARIARAREHERVGRWLSNAMMLRTLTFPVHAADGWTAVIASSGSRGDELISVTIGHYDRAMADPDPYAGARPGVRSPPHSRTRPITASCATPKGCCRPGCTTTTARIARPGRRGRTPP